MRHSFRFKITALLTALLIFTIFLCWFLNKTFLVDYYLHTKKNVLGETFSSINTMYNNKMDENEEDKEKLFNSLERITDNNNIELFIMNSYFEFEYPLINYNNYQKKYDQISSMFKEYFFNGTNPDVKNKELLKETKNYYIYSVVDIKTDMKYIDLIGYIENGKIILMRTNYESMRESVKVANTFLAYVGVIVTFIGTLLMFLFSKRFTRPILELSDIAKKMSDLDFDVKYHVTGQDEIALLGNSINRLSETLEQTISELKRANNELLSDIQNKVEIDEMRTEFLSNVTHELKTPIALIQGYAEGLKENINDDEESRNFYCDVIVDESVKMNKMVKKLLSLNQIESGKNQVNFERFDIVSLINDVLASTELFFKQKDVLLHFEHYEPIYVWADEYLVEEVITNYISNALNHVEGKRIIEVKLIKRQGVVRVAVFNTGKNIPKEDIDNIWIKFYKVDKARTREYGGNGIGLSIVKAIMNSLNRDFGVINRETGVEFWFELDTKI